MENSLQKVIQDAIDKTNEKRAQEEEKRQKELEEASKLNYETYLFYYDQKATNNELRELFECYYIVALDYEKFVLAAKPEEDFSELCESNLILKWTQADLVTLKR